MSLTSKISEDLKTAMKEKNTTKLSVLRVLKSEIQRSEQTANGKIELTDGDVIKVVKKLIEGIKETTKNQDELNMLDTYLPQQMSESELRLVATKLKEAGNSNVGEFMKYFKNNHDGLYDGKKLSNIVKEILS